MTDDGSPSERAGEIYEESDRPRRREQPEENGGDAASPSHEREPRWYGQTDETASEVTEAARRLAALTARSGGENLGGRVERLARSYDSEVLARAVSDVRQRLSDAAGDGVSSERAAELRRRLDRIAEDLWTADVRSERGVCREVLRDVSHDIRSPLNSILFLADGLYSGRSGSLTDAQRRQLGVVYSAAATLLNMVNDLLDFARTEEEGDEHSWVPFSVSSVVSDVRQLVGPIAEHRDCRLRTELEVQEPRYGVPQIVSRVLVNLVANAIDAAGRDGEVVVRFTGNDQSLRLQVLDDGDEVDPERLKRLASPQSDAGFTRTLSGQTHGLGLVICGRMVRSAGGSLDVRRTSDGCTEFTVELPFGRA